MKKFFNEYQFTSFIIISIILFPILELIGNMLGHKFFLQEEALSIIGVLGVLFFFIYFIANLIKKKKVKRIVLSDIFLLTSIFFCIISIIFSKIPSASLEGHTDYSETPLQVLGYFTLFALCTNISKTKNKKYILNTFLILGIIEALVAFLQNFSIWPFPSAFDTNWHIKDHLAFGFTQHCNFFAAIAIIFTALFSEKYIQSKGKKEKITYFLGSTICCLSTFFTYTRIGWVGIFAILFGIIVLEILLYVKKNDKVLFKNHIKNIMFLLITFIICFFIVGKSSGQIEKDFSNSKAELSSLSTDFEKFGTNRGTIWKVGLYALRKYPFTGVGFDIYDFSFLIYPKSFNGWRQNKGHNEYLHTFVTQGIFSGINYIAFVSYCLLFSLRKILKSDTHSSESNLTKIFLIAVFAYFVQALFNSSVTNVAIYKWILMGLLLTRNEQKNFKHTHQ